MLRRSIDTLHLRLVLFVVLVVTPVMGLIIYSGFEQRQTAAEKVKADALRTTHMITAYQEQMILRTHQLLRVLANIPTLQNPNSQGCNAELTEMLKIYPSYIGFTVADPEGDVVCSVGPDFLVPESRQVSTKDWFQRSIDIRKFVVSDVIVNSETGKTAQTFGFPIYDDDGDLQAVISAALDVNQINEFATRAQVPVGSVVTMFDRHGTILARYPEADEWIGKTIPDNTLVKTVLAYNGEGTAEFPGLDGQDRLNAFAYLRFNQQGLYLNVSIPSSVAFHSANQTLARNLGILGIIVLLEIIVASLAGRIFILQPIRKLSTATLQLSEGKMDVHIDTSHGMGELLPLAKAFNTMVQKLGSHEASIREAEARYRTLVEQLPAVIYTISLEPHTFTYVSPRLETLVGIKPEVWLEDRQTWFKSIHPDDHARIERAMERTHQSGEPLRLEYRLLHTNGSYVWVSDEGEAIRDGDGKLSLIQGTLTDITERKEAEEIIQAQSETMRELSTPLLNIGSTVMLMPLIGNLDSQRMQQMMSTLLKGVETKGAKVVILDITGVSVVDTHVANAIIQTERAVRLLGARVVLTGVRPEVAQAMVGLGIDLTHIITHNTLETGISQALSR